MAELVGRRLQQVGAEVRVHGPRLRVVEVRVPAVDGEEGVGERASVPVKGVTVAMFTICKLDVNMNRTFLPWLECQVSYICPHLKG